MTVRLKAPLPLPRMGDRDAPVVWSMLGAAQLVVPQGEIAAVLVRALGGGPLYAVWWDKERRQLVADVVDES